MKTKEFKVGLVTTIAAVTLYLGFNYLKGVNFFSQTTKYYATYNNIDRLSVSNPVLINGYPVGRVSRISILKKQNNPIVVEFEIESEVVLNDSSQAILNSEFLGGKYILLNIGQSNQILNPGDTLKASVAKGMFDVISDTASPVATDLQFTLRKFNEVLNSLSKNSEQLQIIFSKLETTPDLLNQTLVTTNSKIIDASGSFKNIATDLNATLSDLRPILQNIKTVSDSLKTLQLNKMFLSLQKSVTHLNQSLSQLNKKDNTLSKLLTEDTLYVNFNRLILSLDSLSRHLNNNPNHFFAPLGKSHKKIERDLKKEAQNKAKKVTLNK